MENKRYGFLDRLEALRVGLGNSVASENLSEERRLICYFDFRRRLEKCVVKSVVNMAFASGFCGDDGC